MSITARLIIRFYSARGRNWQGRAHRANVTNRHQTKTVEKFGKDSPTVFIYRFSGIPASSYPRCSIKRSSENVSKSIECSNARSMDTRHSFKAFYASIQYGVPVVHSSLQHCKLYVFIQLTAQNYGFYWGPANFFREKPIWSKLLTPKCKSASANEYSVCTLALYRESSKYRPWVLTSVMV